MIDPDAPTTGDDWERWDDFDESAVRVRPNPKANRPRSKRRPGHDDAVLGFVTGVDRGRYRLDVDGVAVTATAARELGRAAVVTGDRVRVVGDVSGDAGTLGRVVGVTDRDSLLRRSADDTDQVERVIVANADRMLIVVAAADPEPRPRFVDRALVAARDAGIDPILCITKTDLADPSDFAAAFERIGVPVVTGSRATPPREALTELLRDHVTVLLGHSGVGKSTLVNALVPEAQRATGIVNAVTGRGRHTSSSSVAYRFAGGWIIDTPGVRSFGLGHVDPASILAGFPDLAALAEECPRGCTHQTDAPDCALDAAVAAGRVDADRLESLRRLVDALGS